MLSKRTFVSYVSSCALLVMPLSFSFADDEQTETLHNNAYQEAAVDPCGLADCQLTFPTTEHVNTVVTNINCHFYATDGAQTVAAYLVTAKNFTRTGAAKIVTVPVFYLGALDGATSSIGINAQVNYFISQGDTPVFVLQLRSGTASLLNCLISGFHS